MLLGEKIKNLRLSCDLTQEELADRCELTKGYISQLENDLTSPSIATLIDILSALGTDLKEFFADSGDDEKIVFRHRKHADQLVLQCTDILEFIHQNIAELLLPGCKNIPPVPEKLEGA